ncbi:KGGVGR-motif variant AAA ATPase [Desulfurispora thermophila]|uniref:KGGVGR-motif variant AAA ATPase n=1 Tax=Desulfurispora thermophila TaxID=265470 RepID=UPI00035C35FB|nr:hypothetical protein [Desulfurispora thermophila]
MKFLTWLDVDMFVQQKRYTQENWPEFINDMRVYVDALEVYIPDEKYLEPARKVLIEWFKDWYDSEKNLIYLASVEQGGLEVYFEISETKSVTDRVKPFKPFFSQVKLFPENIHELSGNRALFTEEVFPVPLTSHAKLFAFYSFKGGVGRTLHLVATVKSLLEKMAPREKEGQILIVDADLEAPGLTWWARDTGNVADFSLLDLLAMVHYDPSPDYQGTINFAQKVLSGASWDFGYSKCYFLPAFRDHDQLLRYPLRPENLLNDPQRSWIIGDLLFRLGEALGVKYIFVDLRAGLSELASPLLFDPRVIRVIVTSFSKQSLDGTELVIKQLSKVVPPFERVNAGEYYDPAVVFSMVPKELSETQIFNDCIERIISLYPDREQVDLGTPTRISAISTFFAQELLYLDSLDSALNKLNGTSVLKKMNDYITAFYEGGEKPASAPYDDRQIKRKLGELKKVSEKLEYAESGGGRGFLPTQPIYELGKKFVQQLPLAVMIGSKGSGKTYLFVQLLNAVSWGGFCRALSENGIANVNRWACDLNEEQALFFPLLEPGNLQEVPAKMAQEARMKVLNRLGKNSLFRRFNIIDMLREALNLQTNWHISEWRNFWVHLIGKALDLPEKGGSDWFTLDEIQSTLKKNHLRIIVIIDGLEEIFQEIKSSYRQQIALYGLLELPRVLSDFRENSLGLICFVRRDLVKASIKQNTEQFENYYKNFVLSWNAEDALRLVLWLCNQARVVDIPVEQLLQMDLDDLVKGLYPVWGRKLGKDNSKEASTANWVLAVLSDFNGQLQARDLVRFMKYAAEGSRKVINYKDRLLQPAGIREAIGPCSEKKIEEYEQEFANLKKVFDKLRSIDKTFKKVPFSVDRLKLSLQEIDLLEAAGVIQEVGDRYYIHEIFRRGLGFELERGARPKVLALKKKHLPATS